MFDTLGPISARLKLNLLIPASDVGTNNGASILD